MRWTIFCLIASFIWGCESSKPVSNPGITSLQVEDPGERIYDYAFDERMDFPPFSGAKRVDLVSMDRFQHPLQIKGEPKAEALPGVAHPLAKSGGHVEFRILSAQTLSVEQLDSISRILFNYGYRAEAKGSHYGPSSCWNPRHALFFYMESQDAIPFASIEICFQCNEMDTMPEKYFTGTYCYLKFKLLKSYFRQIGITYGLDF